MLIARGPKFLTTLTYPCVVREAYEYTFATGKCVFRTLCDGRYHEDNDINRRVGYCARQDIYERRQGGR